MSTQQKASPLDILHLTAQAWDAYYQKRTRECLALAKALQANDPENTEANTLLATVRSDLQRDLNDARALLEDSGSADSSKRHRAAEVMLLKILYLDPDHAEAKVLLTAAKAMKPESAHAPARSSSPLSIIARPEPTVARPEPKVAKPEPKPEPKFEPKAEPAPAPLPEPVLKPIEPILLPVSAAVEPTPTLSLSASSSAPSATQWNAPWTNPEPRSLAPDVDEAPFVVAKTEKKASSTSRTRLPFIAVVVVAVAGFLILSRQSQTTKRFPTPSGAAAAQAAVPVPAVDTTALYAQYEAVMPPKPTATPPVAAAVDPPGTTKVSVAAPTPVAYARVEIPAGVGRLAVSSPTPAEIYEDEKYLGSTPTTLELSAGTHRLQYRHREFRTSVSHVIKASETTTALVTFDTVVQINARPWAQVYLDGAQRQALGQTPLSDVRVPIGKVLIFENPNFPSKSYRVTGNEKSIQMVFP